jgi:ribonuclease-3
MIANPYPFSDTSAVHTARGDTGMEKDTDWANYQYEICYPVEKYLLGYPIQDKQRLISAIISNAFLNETIEFEQLRKIPADKSLATIGDYILDFAIMEHFPRRENTTPKEINDFREMYGENKTLHRFAKTHLRLQNFILWGTDEKNKHVWDQPATDILADRLEMLIGVIYLEKGIGAVKTFLEKHNFFPEIDRFRKDELTTK